MIDLELGEAYVLGGRVRQQIHDTRLAPEIVSSTRRLKVLPLTNLKYAHPAVPTIATVAAVFWTMSAQACSVWRAPPCGDCAIASSACVRSLIMPMARFDPRELRPALCAGYPIADHG